MCSPKYEKITKGNIPVVVSYVPNMEANFGRSSSKTISLDTRNILYTSAVQTIFSFPRWKLVTRNSIPAVFMYLTGSILSFVSITVTFSKLGFTCNKLNQVLFLYVLFYTTISSDVTARKMREKFPISKSSSQPVNGRWKKFVLHI